MAILLENYEETYTEVVKFANANCMIEFVPETRHLEDLPDTMIKILKSQKLS